MPRLFRFLSALALICLPLISHTQSYSGPESILFDYGNNRYLVSNWNNGSIVEVDSNGVQSYFKTGLTACGGSEIIGEVFYSASSDQVTAIDLNTAETLWTLTIPNTSLLNAMTSDSA